jgi:gliding motility-associated-like protein
LPNFRFNRGIIRANGNLLFLGDLQFQAIQNNPTIIEVDSSNGDIIQTIIHKENVPLIVPVDLNELSDGSVFYSAYESLSFGGSILINRVNENLNRLDCEDTSINLNFPIHSGNILNASSWNAQNKTIPLIQPPLNLDTFPLSQAQVLCKFNPLSLDLGKDTTICKGESIRAQGQTTFEGYLWSSGKISSSIQIEKAGTYWLKAWTGCDTISDTIQVQLHPQTKMEYNVSKDTAKIFDTIQFQLIQPTKYQSLKWDFGDGDYSVDQKSIHYYRKSGSIEGNLSLFDSLGCSYDSSFSLLIEPDLIEIPNIFTPNGDGVNDFFQVIGNGMEEMEMSIFNRWGKLIFESKKASWDGRAKGGNLCDTDTYFYKIRFKQSGNSEQIVNGSVSLLR